MKLEQNANGAWRVLMDFPITEQADVETAAVRLFSQASQVPRLRIRDGMTVLSRTQPDTIGGVLVWEPIQHHTNQEHTA